MLIDRNNLNTQLISLSLKSITSSVTRSVIEQVQGEFWLALSLPDVLHIEVGKG